MKEKITLDELKLIQEVLENKNVLQMNPIMPTILGYSIKEIIDEFIEEKTKNEIPALTTEEEFKKTIKEKREEMIKEVIDFEYPVGVKLRKWLEMVSFAEKLRNMRTEEFCLYMIRFYNKKNNRRH